MNHIFNFLTGFTSVLLVFPPTRNYVLDDAGFAEDRRNMYGDYAAVAGDLTKVLSRYGKLARAA